ncbi:MAG: hypothetical protein CMH26_02575 [Micavibrio sp.]|nr:hypothetical protein [Micavibrio sp.]|tara:strand:+ start:2420 stop:4705 length:2286 start_codon:yes stop_codon:yes gene_type:complete
MFFKHVLLSSAAIGALTLATLVIEPSSVSAQNINVVRPVTSWAVSKMVGVSGEYCTIARRYQYGTIVTLAQNMNSESTLAIDFQRPILKNGTLLEVILDPGAGVQRRFNVQPISNQAFVARVGNDAAFFNALKKTGLLRVEVGNQSHHFNMTDIDNGRYELNSCISTLSPSANRPVVAQVEEAKEVGQASPIAPPSMPREVAEYSAQQEREEELALMRERVAEAEREKLAVQQKAIEAARLKALAQSERVQAEAVEASREVEVLASQLAMLRNENEQLKAQALTYTQGQDDVSRVSEQLEQLEMKNAQLTEELKAVYAEQLEVSGDDEVDVLRQELRELQSRNDAQAEQIVALGAQSVELETLRANYAALTRDKEELEKEIASNTGQIDIIASLQRDVSSLVEERDALNQELSVLKSQDRSDEAGVVALQSDNEKLKMALNSAKQELEMLKSSQGEKIAQIKAQYEQQIAALQAGSGNAGASNVDQQKLAALSEENMMLKDRLDQVLLVRASQAVAIPEAAIEQDVAQAEVLAPAKPISEMQIVDAPKSSAQRAEESLRDSLSQKAQNSDEGEIVAARLSQDPLEGFDVEDEAGRAVSHAAPKAPAVEKSFSNEIYHAAYSVEELIDQSLASSLSIVGEASGPAQVVYQWSDEAIFGSALQRPIVNAEQFDDLVMEYLERTETRCPGEFAVVPDDTNEWGGLRMDSYDVACVGADVSSSAALLFVSKDGTFTAIANEGPADQLVEAIENREGVEKAVANKI